MTLKVISHHGAKRNSKRSLAALSRAASQTARQNRTITEWSIHYVDPRIETAASPDHAQ